MEQAIVKFDTRVFDISAYVGDAVTGSLQVHPAPGRWPKTAPLSPSNFAPGSPTAAQSPHCSSPDKASSALIDLQEPFGLWGDSIFSTFSPNASASANTSPLGAFSSPSTVSSLGMFGCGAGTGGLGLGAMGFGTSSPLYLDISSLSPRTSPMTSAVKSFGSTSLFTSPAPGHLPSTPGGGHKSHTLLCVRVQNRARPTPIEVKIEVKTDPRASCVGHDADCILLIVDALADSGLAAEKIMQLNRGSPIIDITPPSERLPSTPSTMLRVRPLVSASGPTFTGIHKSSTDTQMAALSDALLIGLHRADAIPGTTELAIVSPPPHSAPLTDLSREQIHELIASKTLQLAQSRPLENVRHIVLLDFSPQDKAFASICPADYAGLSDKDAINTLCATILAKVETGIRSPSPFQSMQLSLSPPMQVLSASIPLPLSLPSSAIAGRDEVKMIVCLIRGQPEGILKVVKELAILTQQEPAGV